MSASERVANHLPYLRRFARTVTGSQKSGDAYVASALEVIVQDPSLIGEAKSTKIQLYKTVLDIINSISLNRVDDKVLPAKADFRLQTLTPRARQAFLLVSVEELTPREAALVLGVTEREVSAMIDEAGRDIAHQLTTDVLIIEDEPLIALDLKQIVTDLGHRVRNVARTQRQAIEIMGRSAPGLILADIQLADGSSGLDTVKEILAHHSLPVIFITAYPERLLTGARPEPTFLITKPFQDDVVKAVISQALFFHTGSGLN